METPNNDGSAASKAPPITTTNDDITNQLPARESAPTPRGRGRPKSTRLRGKKGMEEFTPKNHRTQPPRKSASVARDRPTMGEGTRETSGDDSDDDCLVVLGSRVVNKALDKSTSIPKQAHSSTHTDGESDGWSGRRIHHMEPQDASSKSKANADPMSIYTTPRDPPSDAHTGHTNVNAANATAVVDGPDADAALFSLSLPSLTKRLGRSRPQLPKDDKNKGSHATKLLPATATPRFKPTATQALSHASASKKPRYISDSDDAPPRKIPRVAGTGTDPRNPSSYRASASASSPGPVRRQDHHVAPRRERPSAVFSSKRPEIVYTVDKYTYTLDDLRRRHTDIVGSGRTPVLEHLLTIDEDEFERRLALILVAVHHRNGSGAE